MQIFSVIGRRGRRHEPKKQLFLLTFAVNSMSNHCAVCRNDDFFTLFCRFYFTLRTKVSRIRRTFFRSFLLQEWLLLICPVYANVWRGGREADSMIREQAWPTACSYSNVWFLEFTQRVNLLVLQLSQFFSPPFLKNQHTRFNFTWDLRAKTCLK